MKKEASIIMMEALSFISGEKSGMSSQNEHDKRL